MLERLYREVNEWVENEENENEKVVYIEGIGILKRMNCELGRGKGVGID